MAVFWFSRQEPLLFYQKLTAQLDPNTILDRAMKGKKYLSSSLLKANTIKLLSGLWKRKLLLNTPKEIF
jgi:hypothetical protein